MNIELYKFTGLPDGLQQQFASEISAETNSKLGAEQKIVPVPAKTILQRGIGLVALQNDALAGYVGATNMHDGYAQVGTLVVPEQNQGMGIGAQLVAGVTELVTEANLQPFAFCNSSSQSSFEKAGYVPALPGELPPKAHSKFNNQSMIYLRQTEVMSSRAVSERSRQNVQRLGVYNTRLSFEKPQKQKVGG